MRLDEDLDGVEGHNDGHVKDLVRVEVLGQGARLNGLEHVERREFHAGEDEREDKEDENAHRQGWSNSGGDRKGQVEQDEDEDERGEGERQQARTSVRQVESDDFKNVFDSSQPIFLLRFPSARLRTHS